MRRARVKAVVNLPVRRKPTNVNPQLDIALANSESTVSGNHTNEVSQSSSGMTPLETLATVAETRKISNNNELSLETTQEQSEPVHEKTFETLEPKSNTQTTENKVLSRRKILRPAVNIPSSKTRLKPQPNKSSPRIQSPIVDNFIQHGRSPKSSPSLHVPSEKQRSPKISPSRHLSSEIQTVPQILRTLQQSPPKCVPAKIIQLAPSGIQSAEKPSQNDSDMFLSPKPQDNEPESIYGITPLPPPKELDDSSMLPNDCFFDPIIPLPSPTKMRPKLKPAPRLSVRRTSVHGSASESEEELRKHQVVHIPLSPGTKQRHEVLSVLGQHRNTPVIIRRESTRLRTESFSSVNSERLVNPTTGILGSAHSKDRATTKIRHVSVTQQPYTGSVGATSGYGGLTAPKRENVRRRTAMVRTGQPRSSFTMYDLIFCNPIANAISDKKEGEEISKKDEIIILPEELKPSTRSAKPEIKTGQMMGIAKMKEDDDNDADDEDDAHEAMPVPQLKLGPNGEIVLDEKSLVVDSTALKLRAEAAATRGAAVIHEDDRPLGSRGTYTRAERSKDWGPRETIRFYRALACIGPDFAMLATFFPGRTRHHLKMKYKKEEKLNKVLIDFALSQMSDYDFQGEDDDLAAELENETETVKRKDEVKTARKTRVKRGSRTNAIHRQICTNADDLEPDNFQKSKVDKSKNIHEETKKNVEEHCKRKSVEMESGNAEAIVVDNYVENDVINTVEGPPKKLVKLENKYQRNVDLDLKNLHTTLDIDSTEDVVADELQNSVEGALTKLFEEPVKGNGILWTGDELESVKNYRVVENCEVTEITEVFDESDLIEESAVNELLEDNYGMVDEDLHVGVEESEDEELNSTPLDKINLVDDSDTPLENIKMVEDSDIDVYESNIEDSGLNEDNTIDVEQEHGMVIDLVENSKKYEIEETDEDLELSSVTVPIAPLPERLEAGSLVLMMTTTASGEKIPRAYLATTDGPNPNLRPIDLPPNIVQSLIGSIGVTNIKLSNPKTTETEAINTNIGNNQQDDDYSITIL